MRSRQQRDVTRPSQASLPASMPASISRLPEAADAHHRTVSTEGQSGSQGQPAAGDTPGDDLPTIRLVERAIGTPAEHERLCSPRAPQQTPDRCTP